MTGPEVLEVTGPGLSLQERPHAGGPKNPRTFEISTGMILTSEIPKTFSGEHGLGL